MTFLKQDSTPSLGKQRFRGTGYCSESYMHRQTWGGLDLLDLCQLPIFSAQLFQLDSKADPPPRFSPHFLRASLLSEEGQGSLRPSHGRHYWLSTQSEGPWAPSAASPEPLKAWRGRPSLLGLWDRTFLSTERMQLGRVRDGNGKLVLRYSRTLKWMTEGGDRPRGHQRVCLVPGQQACI